MLADPFPLYARLRDEDPAHWSPRLKAWVLTRYDGREARVPRHRHHVVGPVAPVFATLPPPEAMKVAELVRYFTLWMVFRDPPEHAPAAAGRQGVQRALDQRAAAQHRATHALAAGRGFREAGIRFIADFAMPLPALVIIDMLGAPREELARLKRLSDEMALFIGSARDAPEKYQRAGAATREMAGSFSAS